MIQRRGLFCACVIGASSIMVAITPPAGTAALYAGGSAMHQGAAPSPDQAPADSKADAVEPATIVTLSERAKQLMSEAKAAQAVIDIFAVTNGMAPDGADARSGPQSPQTLIAHDVSANQGLYIVWSDTR
jgi:hypothetical protein